LLAAISSVGGLALFWSVHPEEWFQCNPKMH
jgi:hypothetical protein